MVGPGRSPRAARHQLPLHPPAGLPPRARLPGVRPGRRPALADPLRPGELHACAQRVPAPAAPHALDGAAAAAAGHAGHGRRSYEGAVAGWRQAQAWLAAGVAVAGMAGGRVAGT